MKKPDILFEDNHLFVINKRPGELSQGDATGETPVQDIIADFIKNRDAKPGNVYIGTIHRLDKPVSGILLFAKTSKAAARLTDMMKSRMISKYYIAITENPKRTSYSAWTRFSDKILRSGDKTVISNPGNPQAQKAEIDIIELGNNGSCYLYLIHLITGKKHQIRAQLSSRKLPIFGDMKYGSSVEWNEGSIALHAAFLSFQHPVKKQTVDVFALPDPAFIEAAGIISNGLNAENFESIVLNKIAELETARKQD